ncbi:MAG: hypothetical protein ABJC63_04785, partial [Gemmatimonadales bacterium]
MEPRLRHRRHGVPHSPASRPRAPFANGDETEDDVYVWWGKTRSERRLSTDPHINDILVIEEDLGAEDAAAESEVHLYLTDYRSLYVAHVGEITADDPRARLRT